MRRRCIVRRRCWSPLVAVLFAAAVLVLTTSCEELLFEPVPGSTPTEIFDQVWTFADEEYSFFEFKGVDWDAVRQEFSPQISDDMSDQALFDVLADMLFELRDGHVNLVSPFDRSRNWQWYLDADPNYDYSVLERHYFTDEDGRSVHEYVGGAFILMDFDDVGYIHYRSFANMVAPEEMIYVINRFSTDDYKGLIIDVRGNGGGAVSNVFTIGNRLTQTATTVAYEQLKSGPGPDDFTQPQPVTLVPPSAGPVYTKPVVVLTNRQCYSATNYFVTMVGDLEHVLVMGDRTGGGGGIPAYTQLTNGWQLRVSTGRLFTVDEVNVEDGIDPEQFASSTESELATGVDTILDTALAYLRAQ